MIDNQVGRRYAEAIYEIAESTDKVKPPLNGSTVVGKL